MGDLSLPSSPRPSTLDLASHTPRISRVLTVPPWERPGPEAHVLPQEPVAVPSGGTGGPEGAQAWTVYRQNHVHTAGILEGSGNMRTQTQRSHVETGTGAAEMLLRAEDRPPPPPGTPLGSGEPGLQAPRPRLTPKRATRPRCSAGGLRQSPLEAVTAEKGRIAEGPRLCPGGTSRTR